MTLALTTGTAASASEMQFGGRVALSWRNTSSDNQGSSEQWGITTTLDGIGYVWRPWFAVATLKLNLAQDTSVSEHSSLPASQQIDNRLVSGEARMKLFPLSRFPLETFVDIYDSGVESDAVGVALTDINTLRRERVGVTQRYRTESGRSNYTAQGVRSDIHETDGTEETVRDLALGGVHAFDTQSVEYAISRSTDHRNELGGLTDDQRGSFRIRHEARPSDALTVETVFDLHREENSLQQVEVGGETTRAADNFMTWRPPGETWTVRTHVGGQRRETLQDLAETRGETAVGTISLTAEITPALSLRGDVGVNHTRSEVDPDARQIFETATVNYAPRPLPLWDSVHYAWSTSASISNTSSTDTLNVQSGSTALRHSLNRVSSTYFGGTLTNSIGQSFSVFRDTRGAGLITLAHQGSAALQWSGAASSSLALFNLSDARTRGREVNTDETRDVDTVLQTADLHGNQQFAASRYSAWEGDLRLGETRSYDHDDLTRSDFWNASVGYTQNHIWGVDRLRFRSRLEYGAQRTNSKTEPITDDQNDERASWDNRLDYVIGLLTLSARRTVTESKVDHTVTTVFSASRVF